MFARFVRSAMERLARATPTELAAIFETAATGAADLEDAGYPRGCQPSRGPVRFEVPGRGGLIVRVERSRLEADDFRLACLFERGSFVFGSVEDLYSFCAGPLARSLGLAVERQAVDLVTAATPDRQLPLTEVLIEEARGTRRRRTLTAEALADRLADDVHGQDIAIERVASVVAGQLAKRSPKRPGSILLLGPTGVGKTATIEALPEALRDLGFRDARVHRIDCAELGDDIQLTRILGVAPGYSGHTDSTALLDALRAPGAIVLFDEIEKACRALQDAILTLLDTGTLTDPNGKRVPCAHAIVALTSNLGWERFEAQLGNTPLGDRPAIARACRAHLVALGVRPELVGRIGALAVFGELGHGACRSVARSAVLTLASEYELRITEIDEVVLEVMVDLAHDSGAGARGLYHAARDVLAESLADVAGDKTVGGWAIVAGPPPILVPAA